MTAVVVSCHFVKYGLVFTSDWVGWDIYMVLRAFEEAENFGSLNWDLSRKFPLPPLSLTYKMITHLCLHQS